MRNYSSQRSSLSAIPPSPSSKEYSIALADIATHILYRSPLPSQNDLPIFILNAAAFPDAKAVDYDCLLPYVLARLPDEDELIDGHGYEIVFFAGDRGNGATRAKKVRPGWGFLLQAYHLLTRLTRKRLQKLYIVHEKSWVRLLVGMFSTVVSPKFNKKVVHVSTLSGLAALIPIEDLLIPPSVYLTDRHICSEIYAPYVSGKRAFSVKNALPISSLGSTRLPRVLREATSFLITEPVIKTGGIFRVNARAVEVEVLKEAYDRAQKFIVWREGSLCQVSPYRKEGFGDIWVEELESTEGFGIHTAAGLIKQWYKDLRTPIFPLESYKAIEKFYGNNEGPFDAEQLLDILTLEVTAWSIMPMNSRRIVTSHLLPMLSRIAEYQDWNQMTPSNLALCFAPTMLRGPDPIQDYEISTIIRRLLEAMIVHWQAELAPAFGTDHSTFEESLRLPEAVEDREDPLEEPQASQSSEDTQSNGITLLENDADSEEESDKPPLPPRRRSGIGEAISPDDSHPLRRKPAPPLQIPPPYSVVVGSNASGTSSVETPASSIPRKPLHNNTGQQGLEKQ